MAYTWRGYGGYTGIPNQQPPVYHSNQWIPMYTPATAYQPVPQPPTPYPPRPVEIDSTSKHNYSATASLINHENPDTGPAPTGFFQKHFGGLKRTLYLFAFVAFLVLVINVSILAYAKTHYQISGSQGTIREGPCSEIKQLNTWLHLGINVLSTLLLTGSNAFMATFACPSRAEVDKAHMRRRWLHVGALSLGNLRGIAWRKGIVVVLLALTSIPFHLLYNSLVFSTLSANSYYWAVVSPEFLSGAPYNLTGPLRMNKGEPTLMVDATAPNSTTHCPDNWCSSGGSEVTEMVYGAFDEIQKSAPTWQRLDNKQCIEAYANIFVAERRNVVLVSSLKNSTNSVLTYGSTDIHASGVMDENWWICSELAQDGGSMTCNPRDYTNQASTWSVFGNLIEYCLSQQVEDVCTEEFNSTIMVIIITFNALKLIAMVWVMFRHDAERILTSVGDAAASFLKKADETTWGMCLADRRHIDAMWRTQGAGRPYTGSSRWGHAVSRKRWLFFILIMILSYGLVFVFGAWGFVHVKDRGHSLTLSSLWSLGFASPHQDTLVIYDGDLTLLPLVIIANIPQLFLAMIYLTFMGIMTAMFIAVDWSNFAFKKQTFMVSSPKGKQRGTWLLGAPIGYGIALLTLQTILHWLVSQSIFVIQINIYKKDGTKDSEVTVSNCGYSPIAIIFSAITAGLLVIGAFVLKYWKFKAGSPPVASTCSAAISAACHPYSKSENMAYEELRWGVNGPMYNNVAHCSLLPAEAYERGDVQPAVPGRPYA